MGSDTGSSRRPERPAALHRLRSTLARLKAELEECLHNIERIVAQTGLEEFMPVVDARGSLTRYPKFRWLFPVFYSICTVGFLILLLYRLAGGRGP